MARKITVTTPENIKIDYDLAGVGSRGGAAVIDSVILLAAWLLLVWIRGRIEEAGASIGGNWAGAILAVITFALAWGYYVAFEAAWNGQTPGKRWLRLRVVRGYGMPIDLPCAAVRNLVRLIDFMPFFYVFGLISMLVTNDCKRLGDVAAGTLVVKERAEWKRQIEAPRPPAAAQQQSYKPAIPGIEMISRDEFEAVKRFVERMPELDAKLREQLAAKIAAPIVERLALTVPPDVVYSNLLNLIYKTCVEDRGMR